MRVLIIGQNMENFKCFTNHLHKSLLYQHAKTKFTVVEFVGEFTVNVVKTVKTFSGANGWNSCTY